MSVSDREIDNEHELIDRADKILAHAWRAGCYALSLAPRANGDCETWVNRDGNWVRSSDIDVSDIPAKLLAARYKLIGGLDVTEDRLPQNGFADSVPGIEGLGAAIATLPTMHGELVTIRFSENKPAPVAEYDKLGLSQSNQELIANTLVGRGGLLLVVGPSANGRMSTLYGMTERFLLPHKKVICAEVAPRRELAGSVLMPVIPRFGVAYDDALMGIRPHEPDVILLGELLDIATVERAIEWAANGKWILSRLNVPRPQDAILRLLHMGISPVLVGSVLRLVIAQRLLRTLCPNCKTKSDAGAYPYVAVGCQACDNTGYVGHRAIFQLLTMSKEVNQCLTDNALAENLDQLLTVLDENVGAGLRQQALTLAVQGITTYEEAIQKTPEN